MTSIDRWDGDRRGEERERKRGMGGTERGRERGERGGEGERMREGERGKEGERERESIDKFHSSISV